MDFKSSITLAFKDAFSSGFTDAKNSIAGMKGALDEINKNNSMTRLAADMAQMTALTEPARRALSNMMDQPSKIAGSMDSSFKNIQVACGASAAEMDSMRRELLAIGGRAVAGPEAVASAFADVAGGIDDASKRMAVMNAAVALSEANQADLAMSTNAMIGVMNAWNLSADKASLAADVLSQTAIMGKGSLTEFAGGINHISALAASAGIGLDELGASFAYLSTQNIEAGTSQKQLKGIISSLLSPSESLGKLYKSLGIESGQALVQQYGLADSLSILKNAVGGNTQAFGDLIGSAEASMIALKLTEDSYVNFAGTFGKGMAGISEKARGVQLESIEAKMARLDAASKSLQAQIGQDINNIKGGFIDFKFGFLSNVVSPIMASPLGGTISKVAAFTGTAAKGILDMGSGAMNAAVQMTTLAANISNAGGIAKMFKSGLGLVTSTAKILGAPLKLVGSGIASMGKSIIGALPAMGSYIASMWASVAPTLAATWPILAIVAGVALLAAGVYLLIKHWSAVSGFFVNLWTKIKGAFSAGWDWIKNLIGKTPDWLLGIVAVFMPFIGIPALIIKHWDGIKAFFTGLFDGLKGAFSGVLDWVKGKVNDFIAPFKWIGETVGSIFNKLGIGAKKSGSDMGEAFASGIQASANAPAAAFAGSMADVSRYMPHSDAQRGPLSRLTASGKSLTETFAKGMDGGVVESKIETVFTQAALPAVPETFTKTAMAGIGDTAIEKNASLSYNASAPGAGQLEELAKIGNQVGAMESSFVSGLGSGEWERTAAVRFNASPVESNPFSVLSDQASALTESLTSGIGDAVINRSASLNFAATPVDGGVATGLTRGRDSMASLLAANTGDIGIERSASLAYNALPIDGGGLASLAAQGNALTESLTSGLGDISLMRNASLGYNVSGMDADPLNGLFGRQGSELTEGLSLPPVEKGLQERAPLAFPSANAKRETVNFQAALGDNETSQKGAGPININIQEMRINAEEITTAFDFVKMVMQIVNKPQGALA
jgi:TP901 family phage tail tape measure protein